MKLNRLLLAYSLPIILASDSALAQRDITSQNAPVAIQYFVDTIGNRDGRFDVNESNVYQEMKKVGTEKFYIFMAGIPPYDSRTISSGPYGKRPAIYESLEEMEQHFEGELIRGLYSILEFNLEGKISRAWVSAGDVKKSRLQETSVPKINYDQMMQERSIIHPLR